MPAQVRLPLTVVTVIVAALATNFLLKRLSLSDLASQLGFTWLFFGKQVDGFLARLRLPFSSAPAHVISPTDYELPWYELVVLGALFLVGIVEVGGGVAGLVGGAFATQDSLKALLILSGLYTLSITVFLIGRWIGLRAGKLAILSLIGAAVLGRLVAGLIDYSMTTAAQFEQMTGQEKGVGNLLSGVVLMLILVATFGLFGLWLGRRARLGHQIAFLIRKLSRADKQQVLESIAQQAQPRPDPVAPVLTPVP